MSETSKRGRHTVARHGELRSPHPLAFLAKIAAIVVAVVLVSTAGVAAYAAYDFSASFADDAVALPDQDSVPPDIGAIEGGVNLFLAGTDACEPAYAHLFGDRCTGPDADVELNDVNMLVHISEEPRKVTVISFPRDLMLPIPACTRADGSESEPISKEAINTAYSIGGLACVVKTVSQLSGQRIPFAAKVTWGGVIEVTDAIGGVEVCLASGIKDYYTGIDWPAGMREVSGMAALQFLRTRHGVGDGSDLGRISNQQQYMSRLANKLMSEDVLSNPATLYKLASTTVENITPSESLTNPLTLVQIALAVKNVPFAEIVFVQFPTVEDPWDADRVVPNESAAAALWAALEENKPIELTGEAGSNDGVVVVEPEPGDEPAASPSATPEPGETAAPAEDVVELPSSITGSTAAQETCSNGNLRDNG
ncbi:LCP family protein [Microbacterium sp. 2FI]|uniref:LCP family protein n=1 Tax=Microbacterium sp. 2FI TaxID=2502193 RepID=UPI001485638F|nr:LCP family protein [Microbacterium sp. 2FI]